VKGLAVLARRFVAGETAQEAVEAGRRLKARGISATFDQLGEDVRDRSAAVRCADANKALLRLIPEGLDRNVSIKLTTLGLDISAELCLELTAGVLAEARTLGGFVRVDMEGSKHTQATLDVFRKLRKEHENVGIVLQAYLHRTEDDVKEAVARGDRVRLCKGAYKEPPSIAWNDMGATRASFKRCVHLLLDKGDRPAVATHDEELIQDVVDHVRATKLAASQYEFQMLYGLRPRRWDSLVAAGHKVRIYVPYGTHWLPYFYRRLRERRENVLFVLRSLLGG
jgi:proline dehydrogenase